MTSRLIWNRINDLPDYVYFNHSIHIAKGVGCSSCHGEVDRMALTTRPNPSRCSFVWTAIVTPAPNLRPTDQIYNTEWRRTADTPSPETLMTQVPCWRPQPHGLFNMSPVSQQWRSLKQLADDPSFIALAAQEFPSLAEALASPRDRRRVLKLMTASFVMAGLGGCDVGAPGGHLIPAVRVPPNIIPGLPNFYATANVLDGYATGVVVKHQMGRPIKVEGNPRHPASLGATDVFAQAQVLDFYDPDRAWAITAHGLPADRQSLQIALTAQRAKIADSRRQGIAHSYRHDHIADPSCAAGCTACKLPRSSLAPVGADLARQCFKGRRAGLRPACRD